MAAQYIAAIKTVQEEGPYYLGGYCFGGLIAQEMAQQLQNQGDQVALLAIFDLIPHLYAHLMPADTLQQYDQYAAQYKIKRYVHQMKDKILVERMKYLTGGFIRQVRNYLTCNRPSRKDEQPK